MRVPTRVASSPHWWPTVVRASRAAERASQLTGRGSGGVIGGRVILALAPDCAPGLAEGRATYLVTGTNGKTTTTAYVAAALGSLGPVDSNADGANTPPGIVRALARGAARQVVLETDEGWIPWAAAQTRPAAVVLTNLSRDQLHRHHEPRHVVDAWRSALTGVGHAVANVDDPAIVWSALGAPSQTWVAAGIRWRGEARLCPRCGAALTHGSPEPTVDGGADWSCARCGLRRPQPDWWLEGEELVGPSVRLRLSLSIPGAVNLGNAAQAIAVAVHAGADPAAAAAALASIRSVAGRYAVQEHRGRRARMILAKNPASWTEALSMLTDPEQEHTPIVLSFNCEGVDGRDASWLYDVPFAGLAGRDLVVTGRRAADLAVRLELEGLGTVRTAPDVRAALELLPAGEVTFVGNYTAFQDARRELERA